MMLNIKKTENGIKINMYHNKITTKKT